MNKTNWNSTELARYLEVSRAWVNEVFCNLNNKTASLNNGAVLLLFI